MVGAWMLQMGISGNQVEEPDGWVFVSGCKEERQVGSTNTRSHHTQSLTFPLFSWGADHRVHLPSLGVPGLQVTPKGQSHGAGAEPKGQTSGIYGDEPFPMEELHVATHPMTFSIQGDHYQRNYTKVIENNYCILIQ